MGSAIIISKPAYDFEAFLSVGVKLTGENPARYVDTNPRQYSNDEKYAQCLATYRGGDDITDELFQHMNYSVLMACDDRDFLDIIAHCQMPFIVTDTIKRNTVSAVVTGSLKRWRDATVTGTHPDNPLVVRKFFESLVSAFENVGAGRAWKNFDREYCEDALYLKGCI